MHETGRYPSEIMNVPEQYTNKSSKQLVLHLLRLLFFGKSAHVHVN